MLSHWRQISIFQLIRKMNSHSKILFLILSAGALQKMYLNVVWWMICLLVNELTKLKGRLMMCWWASLILFHLRHQKTFPKISALFCTWVVWAFGSVFFLLFQLFRIPKGWGRRKHYSSPLWMTICRKQNSRIILPLNFARLVAEKRVKWSPIEWWW